MLERTERRPSHIEARGSGSRMPGALASLHRMLALVSIAILSACAPQPPEPPAQARPPAATAPAGQGSDATHATPPVVPRAREPGPAGLWDIDLQRDESRGGHTIARHVGRTDTQLQARLARESISAASTYPDLATAERVVQRALDEHGRRVQAWIDRRPPKPNLAIRYRARDGLPTGRILARGDTQSRESRGAVAVLRWRDAGWYVLTSYPENVQ